MGCDIHIVVEKKWPSYTKWTGIWASDCMPGRRPRAARRDYDLFSRFGIRGRSERSVIYPRNLPRDVSCLAWNLYMDCPSDHHGASHCTITEFTTAFIEENGETSEVRPEWAAYDLFGISEDEDDGAEYRLVFWFDN